MPQRKPSDQWLEDGVTHFLEVAAHPAFPGDRASISLVLTGYAAKRDSRCHSGLPLGHDDCPACQAHRCRRAELASGRHQDAANQAQLGLGRWQTIARQAEAQLEVLTESSSATITRLKAYLEAAETQRDYLGRQVQALAKANATEADRHAQALGAREAICEALRARVAQVDAFLVRWGQTS